MNQNRQQGPAPVHRMPGIGPSNQEIAEVLEQMAELFVRLKETNPYRVRAYLVAAETIRACREPLFSVYGRGGRQALEAPPGIGSALASHVASYLETGRVGLQDRLMVAADPVALFATVPGIGPALAARIAGELGLRTLGELERAVHDGRLAAIEGMGPRRLEALRLQLNSILSRAARKAGPARPAERRQHDRRRAGRWPGGALAQGRVARVPGGASREQNPAGWRRRYRP
jgi:DNA polymerase (family X)